MSTDSTQHRSFAQRLYALRPNPTVLLFIATIAAILIANSPWNDAYNAFLNHPVHIAVGDVDIFRHAGHTMTVSQVVNDALMAIFFFLVGLEIKQELLVGELSSPKKALLPIIAALGGMVVPVLFFLAIANQHPQSIGAAIPMATDIAFALAVLTALGSRVPKSLRIFLAALAVVDDIGGIVVIAVFYSTHISWLPLGVGFALLGVVLILGRLKIHTLELYIVLGIAVWALFLQSGIHPTIAGVLIALCLPAGTKVHIGKLSSCLTDLTSRLTTEAKESNGALVLSHEQLSIIGAIKSTATKAISPVQLLEHAIAPFAFVNAGIAFGGITSEGLLGVPLAIFLGLFPGKAIGITLFTWIAIRVGICAAPTGMTLKRLIALSILGGIGFTVSLFIANLSYDDPSMLAMLNEAKLGIFVGTIVSGIVGYALLYHILPRAERSEVSETH